MAIQIRRGTESEWEAGKQNIVVGEPCVTTDTGRFFVGTEDGFSEMARMEDIGAFEEDIEALQGEVGEINEALETKADKTDTYSKEDVDGLLEGKASTEALEELSEQLDSKADSSAVYTKTETDTLLSAKANASDLEELEEEMTDYRQMYLDSLIHTTASGSIASFSDGSDGLPMDFCTATIEPVQDLHGQANPYPAGGGKNKFDPSILTEQAGWKTVKLSLPLGTYTMSTSKPNNNLPLYFRLSSDTTLGSNNNVYNTHPVTRTIPDGDTVEVVFRRSGGDDVFSNYWFQIEEGSTATAYAPYENICPISGWTGAEVVRTGKNLIKTTLESQTKNGITYTVNDDGSIRVQGTATTTSIGYIGNCTIREDATYYVSGCPSGGSASTYRMYISWGSNEIGNGSQRALTEGTLVYLQIFIASGVTIDATFKPMLCKLSSGTDYEPYQADTYSASWEDEVGTVYGRSVDLVSGVLTVTNGYIASYNGETLPSTWISDRDVYAEGATPTVGAEVVYELAQPTTYQLTPQEVTTLLGSNNVWSDTGDIDCGYVANTKLYIDSKLS